MRAKGKFHFLCMRTLLCALLLFFSIPLANLIFEGSLRIENWVFRLAFSLFAGLILSLAGWWSNEATYKNAKIDAYLEFQPRGKSGKSTDCTFYKDW
jgi:hypothetical protein